MRIFISNLDYSVTYKQLRKHLESFVPIDKIYLKMLNKEQNIGYSFVDVSEENGKRLIDIAHNSKLGNRKIKLKEAE